VDSWFKDKHDNALYCFARVSQLRTAMKSARVIDALFVDLNPPGKGAPDRKLPREDKLEIIDQELRYRLKAKASRWRGASFLEALAGELWSGSLPKAQKKAIWHSVAREADLLRPIVELFRADGLATYQEVKMGRYSADVLAHQAKRLLGLVPERFIAIELKNEISEFKRGLNQLATFADYTHTTYMACTASFGAEYLHWHANAATVRHWDPDALTSQLRRAGIGLLLLVEPDGFIEVLPAAETGVEEAKVAELRKEMSRPGRAV
jgi:hypothetical protein